MRLCKLKVTVGGGSHIAAEPNLIDRTTYHARRKLRPFGVHRDNVNRDALDAKDGNLDFSGVGHGGHLRNGEVSVGD
jgi:hypothetical protein